MNEMNNPFEKIVRGSAPEVPDAGNTRRTNRALMQERIRRDVPRRKRNFRLGVIAAGLALVVLFSGQVSDVGSDGWDIVSENTTDVWGRPSISYERTFGPGSIIQGGPSGHDVTPSKEMARDILMAEMIRENEVSKALGLEVHGKISWLLKVEVLADGELVQTGFSSLDPPSQDTPDHLEVVMSDLYPKILETTKNIPPQYSQPVTLDGITFQMNTWVFPDTPFGTVKYHEGFPIP